MGTTYTITTDEYERMKLLALLKSQHLGRTRAVKKRDLLRELYGAEAEADRSYNNPFDRKLRKMMEELVQAGYAVCSSAQCGYWYASSLDDGLGSVRENKSRALTQLGNAERLEQNILAEYGGQMGMF